MNESLQFQFYKIDDENEINALVKDNSIWLTQKAMGEFCDVGRASITRYLKNIFESGELEEKVVCAKIEHTTPHGAMADKTQTGTICFYNPDAIISVGYRVNSLKATRFRQRYKTNFTTQLPVIRRQKPSMTAPTAIKNT